MPLIRYRTEDFTRPVDLECPCGRKMPLVAPFETRVTGMLVTPNGRVMAYALVNYAFMGLENIRKSQIVQESPEDVVVRLVAAGEFSDTDRRSVIERLEQLMGEGTHVEVELVDDIPREAQRIWPAIDVWSWRGIWIQGRWSSGSCSIVWSRRRRSTIRPSTATFAD